MSQVEWANESGAVSAASRRVFWNSLPPSRASGDNASNAAGSVRDAAAYATARKASRESRSRSLTILVNSSGSATVKSWRKTEYQKSLECGATLLLNSANNSFLALLPEVVESQRAITYSRKVWWKKLTCPVPRTLNTPSLNSSSSGRSRRPVLRLEQVVFVQRDDQASTLFGQAEKETGRL